MHARRDEPSIPAWSGDRLESSTGPEIEAPYFDEALKAWVLSRYADVLEALRSPGLTPAGPKSAQRSQADPAESAIPGDRLKMREDTLEALSPALLKSWRDRLSPKAESLAASLPVDVPVDLIEGFARPLCLICSSIATGIELEDARQLQQKAQQVSAAAADPWDPLLRAEGKSATAGLRGCFHSGAETLRDSGFVALSQTMIGILGNAWFALLQHPQEWDRLHRQPELIEQAIEELLRYAGLVRIICRIATADVSLNGTLIDTGQRVILRIFAANRDPERFPQASQLDVARGAGHLTLGAGSHSCVGASLVRMAAVTVTLPLLERFAAASLSQSPAWQGGPVFRWPSSLWASLRVTTGIHQAGNTDWQGQ
jgi:cytochrome P450